MLSSSVEVHVGRSESLQSETPRRGRPYQPQYEAGLQVGQMKNEQGEAVGSVSKTVEPRIPTRSSPRELRGL